VANRLQRIMAMDQMIQNRNMPQIGTQNIFDPTTGQFVKVEYQTDPNFPGRRTVMTRTGPQALPGFQGQENPYRALGRGVRNLLGNLFDRGSLRREERKREQGMEQADQMLDTMDPSVLQRPEFDPVPDNQARIDELQERINRPIVTSQNLPTFDVSQMSAGKMGQSDSLVTLANGDQAIQRVNKIGSNTYVTLIDPTSMRVISSTLPRQTTTPTTQTTGEEDANISAQVNPFSKKIDREIDFDAAVLLPKDEQEKYLDPNISDAEFERLNKKAKVLLAKTPKKEKPTQGIMSKKTAFTQMTLAAPTLKRLEQNAKLMEQLGGFSGAMARNFRSMADPNERLYLQAADAWIRAKLRDESGAAIGEKEMEQEYATFFPQLNDTPETIAEKARQREVLTRQMGINAGEIKETKQDKEQTTEAETNNALPTVSTQEQYDALPSGAKYLEDGQEFRKP